MHSALLVADYLIAHSQGTLTPLHVIKLTYMSHGYTLAIRKKPLISDRVEAWPYGPVIPRVYDYVKEFGKEPVKWLPYCATGVFDNEKIEDRKQFLKTALGKHDILDKVLEKFGVLTAYDLTRLTHTEGSPWDQCYKKGRHEVIPTEVTQKYYEDLVA